MFYIQLILVIIWGILAFCFGTIYAVLFWGNKNINQNYVRVFSWGILKILRIRVQIEGEQYFSASQPCIYVANHQSGLDIALMGRFCPPHTIAIGKKELLWVPFLGLYFVSAGNILINRGKKYSAIATLNRVVQRIHSKKLSVWIFPEGSRNPDKGLLPFKWGAFHLAIQAQVPLVPIICAPLQPVFSWKKRYVKPGLIRIRVLPPIETKHLSKSQFIELSKLTYQQMSVALKELSKKSPDGHGS